MSKFLPPRLRGRVVGGSRPGGGHGMYFFFQIALSGVATGAIYGLIAVGYSLTFMTTKALNFALGMWVMLGGMLTYSLVVLHGIHPLVVLPVVTAALFVLGLVAERISVMPFLRAGSDVWIMSTLAVGFLMIDFAEIIWGRSPTPVPPLLGKDPIYIGSVSILPQQLVIIAAACVVFVALDLFYRRTLVGKAFRAVAHSGETSALMGINTRRVQAVSYAAAAALAGIAGFLVVPLTLAEPQLGTVLGLKAFAIAIIAGLAAPRGILICGLAYGALEGLISGYFYTGIRDILGFSLMILALYLKPEGLFGKAVEERA
jgi:branched-chain amino acid transport system permease protein